MKRKCEDASLLQQQLASQNIVESSEVSWTVIWVHYNVRRSVDATLLKNFFEYRIYLRIIKKLKMNIIKNTN